jgi:hypothetical protein
MAADLRVKADQVAGAERDYFLWLAQEWEKTADRETAVYRGAEREPAA